MCANRFGPGFGQFVVLSTSLWGGAGYRAGSRFLGSGVTTQTFVNSEPLRDLAGSVTSEFGDDVDIAPPFSEGCDPVVGDGASMADGVASRFLSMNSYVQLDCAIGIHLAT